MEADVRVFVGRVEHKRLVAGQRVAHVGRVLGRLVEGGDEVEVGLDGHVVEDGKGALRELGIPGLRVQGVVDFAEFSTGRAGAADTRLHIGIGRGRAGSRVGGGDGADECSKEEDGRRWEQHSDPRDSSRLLCRCASASRGVQVGMQIGLVSGRMIVYKYFRSFRKQ